MLRWRNSLFSFFFAKNVPHLVRARQVDLRKTINTNVLMIDDFIHYYTVALVERDVFHTVKV